MGWFGPRGSCGCCGPIECLCADPSQHSLDVLTYQPPAGSGGLAVRIEVWGVPATYSWRFAAEAFGGTSRSVVDAEASGMSWMNGTYFVQISDAPCVPTSWIPHGGQVVDGWGTPGQSYDVNADHMLMTLPSCDLNYQGSQNAEFPVTRLAILSRAVMNDLEFRISLSSSPPGGWGWNGPGAIRFSESLRCSEGFEAKESPVLMQVGVDYNISTGECDVGAIPGVNFDPAMHAIGTARIELVRTS